MKIILLKDVKKIGQKGQVVEVQEGYGRNFLIKKGFGKLAVGGVLKDIENKKKIKNETIKNKIVDNEKAFFDAKGKSFIIKAKASDKGHLFVGIHKKDIAERTGLEEKNIILEKDIKEIGDHILEIKMGNKKGKIKLAVEGE